MRLLKLFLILPIFLILLIVVVGYFDPDCNYRVGRAIETLFPGERAKANYWYERAAKQGNLSGLSYAGMYYLFGYGPQDKQLGLEYLKKAAKENDLYAQSCLASAYEWGLGVEQNFEKARDLTKTILKEYEDQNITGERKAKARSRLAYLYTIAPPPVRDYKEGARLLQGLIDELEQEDNPAESLGLYYYYGLLGKRDFKKAARFLESGARLGGAQSRQCIGNCFLSGRGVEPNYKLANKWLNLAAEEGNFISQEILAVASGIGIPVISGNQSNQRWRITLEKRGFLCFKYFQDKQFENPQKALIKLKTDSNSDPRAATILGIVYQYGIGVDENLELAGKYFKEAQDKGSVDAKVVLAEDIFQSPRPMEQYQIGNKLIAEACISEHPTACIIQALNQSGGITCKQNWTACFKTLSKTKLEMDPEAKFMLGQCYLYGLGTKRDAKKGLRIIYALSLAGYPDAAIYFMDNYDTFDNSDKIKWEREKVFAACEKLEIPELQFKWALVHKDKEKAKKLLVMASANGFQKAKTELNNREYFMGKLSVDDLVSGKDKSKLAKRPLISIEKQVSDFRSNFVRDSNSKQVLRATKNLKKGDLITKDSYELVDADFVLGTYLDGNQDTLNFVNGKTCTSDIAKGSEISVYDIGLPKDDPDKQ